MELYAEITGRKITWPNLYLENMAAVACLSLHRSEVHRVQPPTDLVQPLEHFGTESGVSRGAV
jgi:hypothetical protein